MLPLPVSLPLQDPLSSNVMCDRTFAPLVSILLLLDVLLLEILSSLTELP